MLMIWPSTFSEDKDEQDEQFDRIPEHCDISEKIYTC